MENFKKFNDLTDGEAVPHNNKCFRFGDTLCNETSEFVRTNKDITEKCPNCKFRSQCKELLTDNAIDVYRRKQPIKSEEKPQFKTKRGKKRN